MTGRTSTTITALLLLSACGGAGQVERIVTPFTAEHEPVFENGLDLVRDPEALGGAWLGTWEEDLDARVSLADLVLLVTVQTIRQDTDLDRRDTFRLVVHVDRRYLGEIEDELTLVVRENQPGFQTIETNERHLLQQQFIAFIKWQRDETDGEVRARWHLAPATEAVAERTRTLLAERRQVVEDSSTSRHRVIVHTN
ncbi:MAG: hypothetical protein H6719_01260 [Sandaracinaceae bacterium]|nr:hypothetical protein [Sandaracinaceae bacterium]